MKLIDEEYVVCAIPFADTPTSPIHLCLRTPRHLGRHSSPFVAPVKRVGDAEENARRSMLTQSS